MKTRFIFIAAIALSASACADTVENTEPCELQQVTIHASLEGAMETKTSVLDGGTQVFWEPSEFINVFFNGYESRFQSQNTSLAVTANFIGSLSNPEGSNEGATDHPIWGLYPYRSDATADDTSVTTTLPATQTGRAGSFAKDTHITLACSDDYNFTFYNATGGVRFSLTHEGVKSVTLEGNNGEALAGRVRLAFESGVPAIKSIISGEQVVTLNAPVGETFQTGKWYYIETLPTTFSKGFKMTFIKGNETANLESSASTIINRGRYGSLADVDASLVFNNEGGDPSAENIVFADEKVKAKLVAAFDTNGDGELSYAEAAAVTSLKGVFGSIKTYKSFDEFQYFTGMTSITASLFEGWIMTSITLPNTITSIGASAFKSCTKLTHIDIPDTVVSIGNQAFAECSSLLSLEIPNEIPYIGSDASLMGCSSIKTIVIPNSVKSIGMWAFNRCTSLTSVVIPEGVTSICDNAFYGCSNMTSVLIPGSVTSIQDYAFRECTNLSSVVIPESTMSIGDYAFKSCTNLTSIVLPEGVTRIGKSAFESCSSLTSIVIPESVSVIRNYTFRDCTSLTSIVIPESVSSIEGHAFNNCVSLTSIVIPESVVIIWDGVFMGCSGLTSVVLPEDLAVIYDNTFHGCSSLSSIELPKGLTSIGGSAFRECTSLISIVIPEGVTSIGVSAFERCTGLTSVVLSEGLTSIEGSAFERCSSLTSIVIPESVTSIGVGAFERCTSLASIVIPESITSIEVAVFSRCTSLKSIVIPESVNSIGDSAFSDCTAMSSCTFLAETPPSLGTGAFFNNDCLIFVPSVSVEAYKEANNWSEYASRIYAISN